MQVIPAVLVYLPDGGGGSAAVQHVPVAGEVVGEPVVLGDRVTSAVPVVEVLPRLTAAGRLPTPEGGVAVQVTDAISALFTGLTYLCM